MCAELARRASVSSAPERLESGVTVVPRRLERRDTELWMLCLFRATASSAQVGGVPEKGDGALGGLKARRVGRRRTMTAVGLRSRGRGVSSPAYSTIGPDVRAIGRRL